MPRSVSHGSSERTSRAPTAQAHADGQSSTRQKLDRGQLLRRMHLLSSIGILYYVYATPPTDAISTLAVRWVATPMLVLSGLVMWQWPRLRRWLRAAARARAEVAR